MGTKEDSSLIRSVNTDHPSWVSFFNTTLYEIELMWINYEGQAVSYVRLGPRRRLNMRTFATHPWIFLEAQTMERFMVQGKDVFYPIGWKPSSSNPDEQRQSSPYLVCITIPMYSLREIAMKTIKRLLSDDSDAYLLMIPKNLQRDLANLEPRKRRGE